MRDVTQEGACTLSGLSYSGPSEEELARNRHVFAATATSSKAPEAAASTPAAATAATSAPQEQAPTAKAATAAPSPAGKTPAGAGAGAGAGAKRTGSAITQADMSPKLHVLERESVWEVCSVHNCASYRSLLPLRSCVPTPSQLTIFKY